MGDNDTRLDLATGTQVRIATFDDVPEHTFDVFTVEDGFVTGVAITGPLAGEYQIVKSKRFEMT